MGEGAFEGQFVAIGYQPGGLILATKTRGGGGAGERPIVEYEVEQRKDSHTGSS